MHSSLSTRKSLEKSNIATLRAHPFCRAIDQFLRSPAYLVAVGILTIMAATLSMELITYTCFILIGLFVALFGSDLLPLVPLVPLSYISPSISNNPGLNAASVFAGASGIYILCIAGLLVVSLIFRLCTDRQIGQKAFLTCKRSMLPGMLILGAAYMLAGAFSGYYTANSWRNAFFGFIQFLSVALFYFLFTGGIQWNGVPKKYLAWVGLCIGSVILVQLFHLYLANNVIVDGQIIRERIFCGWGTCNNIGALLAMVIPFVFFLAFHSKRPWIYEIVALLFMAGVFISCSRASILVAGAVYFLSYGVLAYKRFFKPIGWFLRLAMLAALLSALFVLFRENLLYLFESLISRGWGSSERIEIYAEGIKQFLKLPIFGGSFFPLDYVPFEFSSVQAFSSFFPPRWHNTIIQMLASCGAVGFTAYIFHRWQTITVLMRKPTAEKIFISLSILVLLGTSMVDCHFFNVGPTLFYSTMLAFAEKADSSPNI